MQNSHSDVQQSSYRCINHERNRITRQSMKGSLKWLSELSHVGNGRHWMESPFPPRLCKVRTNDNKGRENCKGLKQWQDPQF